MFLGKEGRGLITDMKKNTGKKNIYLVGFMGTGKSSAGKELAKKKKWRFLDLDELIELR